MLGFGVWALHPPHVGPPGGEGAQRGGFRPDPRSRNFLTVSRDCTTPPDHQGACSTPLLSAGGWHGHLGAPPSPPRGHADASATDFAPATATVTIFSQPPRPERTFQPIWGSPRPTRRAGKIGTLTWGLRARFRSNPRSTLQTLDSNISQWIHSPQRGDGWGRYMYGCLDAPGRRCTLARGPRRLRKGVTLSGSECDEQF